MKITFKDIVWIVLLILVVVALSKCHRDKVSTLNDQYDAIVSKYKDDSIAHARNATRYLDTILKQQQVTQVLSRKADSSTRLLEAAEVKVLRLSLALQAYKVSINDTGIVTVPTGFVNYCDSLSVESEYLVGEVRRYKDVNAALVMSKDREIAIRDTILMQQRTFNEELRSQFTDLRAVYEKSQQLAKPRAQVYVGAELIGTQTTFLQQVGGVLSLKTKGNKLWQISSGLQNNGQLYGRVSGSILLTFK